MGNVVTLPNMDHLLTASQAAHKMGVSTGYMRRLRVMGWLKEAGRVGNTVLYNVVDIEAYIASHPGLGARRKIV